MFIRRKNKHVLIDLTAGLMLLLFSAGCGEGIPDDLGKKARAIPGDIEKTRAAVKTDENNYNSLKNSPEFKRIERFALRENWVQSFPKAEQELKRAEGIFNEKLKPLIKKKQGGTCR